MKTQRSTSNPELYATLSAPFDTTAEAQAAMEAFLDDVHAARVKHRVGNMLVVPLVTSKELDRGALTKVAFYGDQRLAIPVATEALIHCRKMREEAEATALRSMAGSAPYAEWPGSPAEDAADDTEAP